MVLGGAAGGLRSEEVYWWWLPGGKGVKTRAERGVRFERGDPNWLHTMGTRESNQPQATYQGIGKIVKVYLKFFP